MTDKLFTYGPSNVDQLLATTTSVWASNNLEDQVFGTRPLLKKLYSKAKKQEGGASILLPVMYAKNTTMQFYDEYQVLDVTPQDGLTNTQAKWKNAAVSITISGTELDKNRGEAAIINLLQTKTNQAVESLKDGISEGLFAAAPGSTDLSSLVTMIDATSTIQDVNSTTNSWWQATVTSGGSFATQGLDDMRTTDNTVQEYNPSSMLDTIVTTKDIYNYYEGSLTPMQRYASRESVDPTFASIKFRNADVISDPNATSGVIYMFSTDDLYLMINSAADYRTTEFVKPANQDAKTAQIILRLELMTRARRKLAKITGVTA